MFTYAAKLLGGSMVEICVVEGDTYFRFKSKVYPFVYMMDKQEILEICSSISKGRYSAYPEIPEYDFVWLTIEEYMILES